MTEPALGHNSNLTTDQRRKLNGFISQIERLDEERRGISTDISEIFASAKDTGFDVAAMRHHIRMRRMEREKREALQNAIDAYQLALDFSDPPKATLPDTDTSSPPFLPGDDEMKVAGD